jgi:hypothetical protein
MTTQVRQRTITAAATAEVTGYGRLERFGTITNATSELVGQTPTQVKRAIFHRGGESAV